MAACNVYNEEHQQLLVKFFDLVTLEDLQDQARQLMENNVLTRARRKYISFFAVREFGPGITQESVQQVVASMAEALGSVPEARTAFVAPTEETLGVALMFRNSLPSEIDRERVQVFTTREEAMDWLGGSSEQWRMMRDRISRMCNLVIPPLSEEKIGRSQSGQ